MADAAPTNAADVPTRDLHPQRRDAIHRLLARIDGQRTVAELLAAAGKPRHMVLASLEALRALRLVDKA